MFFNIPNIFSQTAVNLEVISSAGGYFPAPVGSNITLSWTLGEPVIETFAPNGSSIILTQGFQQPTVPGTYSVDGNVLYDNTALNPMPNIQLTLINSELVTLGTTTTDVNGHFVFSNVPDGVYTLSLSSSDTWGGANSTDALLINKYFVKLYNFKDALVTRAANVDNDAQGKPTATDGLYIMKRFIKVITSFKISDWLFDNTSLTVAGANVTQIIKTVCAGDVNADRKFSKSSDNDLTLQNSGIINVVEGQEFELPISVANSINIGAFSLVIKFPAKNLKVKEINSSFPGFMYNIINDEIRMAWADNKEKGINLNADDAIIKIRMQAYNISTDKEVQLVLDPESNMADINPTNIKASLYAPRLAFETVSSDFYLGQNYPNPYKNTTQIDYRLSESAQVSVKVYNLLGEQIREIVNSYQDSGYHQINFNAAGIADGVYMYKMEVNSAKSQFSKTKMMIINR